MTIFDWYMVGLRLLSIHKMSFFLCFTIRNQIRQNDSNSEYLQKDQHLNTLLVSIQIVVQSSQYWIFAVLNQTQKN